MTGKGVSSTTAYCSASVSNRNPRGSVYERTLNQSSLLVLSKGGICFSDWYGMFVALLSSPAFDYGTCHRQFAEPM